MKPVRYPFALRLMHWAMAVLIAAQLGLGLAMIDSLAPWRTVTVRIHALTGLGLAVLVLVRVCLRKVSDLPKLPGTIPLWQRRTAEAMHLTLYLLMAGMPLSGLMLRFAAGVPVSLPGGVLIPSPIVPDLVLYAAMRELHAALAAGLLSLVMIHAAAALHHALVRRDDLHKTML